MLTRADVAALLSIDDCIRVVETAFRQHALGTAVPPIMVGVHVDGGGFHIKAAGVHEPRPFFAAKINGNFSGNPLRFGLPTIQGVIVLADLTSGSPIAVLDSIEITIQRTAAASAVAAKHLACPAAQIVTIVGCGVQGRAQLRALSRVRSVAQVHAFDIDEDAAHRFAGEMTTALGVPVSVAPTLRPALLASDIVVTCTTSRQPFVGADDLAPGTFVAAVGADNPDKHEIEASLLASATVVADVLEQAVSSGDLHHAVAAGLMTRSGVHAELGEIVAGMKPGRRAGDEIIVFDSTGMALQDVVASALVYERAMERGVGRRIAFNE